MKKVFKKYAQYEISEVRKNLSSRNKKLLDDFRLVCGATASETKLRNIDRVLTKVCDVIEVDLDKLDLKTLREFLNVLRKSDLAPATKNEIKKHFKRFIRENYDDWSKKFKGLRDMKLEKDWNQEKYNSNTRLRKEDITRLIKGTDSLKFKSVLVLLYESAGRPEEVLKLRWKDVNFDRNEVKLTSSKTGNVRVLLVDDAIKHLERYKSEFMYEDLRADDWVFPSTKNRYKHLSVSSLDVFIKRLGIKVLHRHIFPYLIRHSRLTMLMKTLPPKIYERFSDHSIQMASRYEHLDNDDMREVLKANVYDIKELEPKLEDKYKKDIKYLKGIIDGGKFLTRDDFYEDIQNEFVLNTNQIVGALAQSAIKDMKEDLRKEIIQQLKIEGKLR